MKVAAPEVELYGAGGAGGAEKKKTVPTLVTTISSGLPESQYYKFFFGLLIWASTLGGYTPNPKIAPPRSPTVSELQPFFFFFSVLIFWQPR